jgi:DNA-binding MurR/RpiR family transcriptional regulator
MKYTAGQAAKAAGVSKATITRSLQSGKISGVKDNNGSWSIDPAELHRVFPPVAHEPPETEPLKRTATPKKPDETEVLERENHMLREALAEARQDRDRWHQIAERLSIAPPAPEPATSLLKPVGSFWSRLIGKK